MKIKKSTPIFKLLATLGLSVIGVSAFAVPSRAALFYNEIVDAPGGDLSNNRLNPNFIGALMQGKSSVSFILNNPLVLIELGPKRILRDLDYFYVAIPEGFVLSQLNLSQYDPSLGGVVTPGTDQIAFIGLQAGTQFTEPAQPSECPTPGQTDCNPVPSVLTNTANLLGYTLIGTEDAANLFASVNKPGDNLLPFLGATLRPNLPSPPGVVIPSPIPNNGQGFRPPLKPGNYVFWAQQTAPGKVSVQLDFVVSPIPEPSSTMAVLAFGSLGAVSLWRRKK